MYSVFIVAGFLISISMQHFVPLLTRPWCQLASTCNHTGISECGEELNKGKIQLFLDECYMVEFNCENHTEFKKVDMVNCQNASMLNSSTSETQTSESTIGTTIVKNTTATPTNNDDTVNETSITVINRPTELENQTPHLPPISKCTRRSDSTSSLPCSRKTNTITTIKEITSTTSLQISTNVTISSSNSLSNSNPDSTVTSEGPENINSSSLSNTESTLSMSTMYNSTLSSSTPLVQIDTTENIMLTTPLTSCSRNSNQSSTQSSNDTTMPYLPTSMLTTTEISSLVTNVTESQILQASTQQITVTSESLSPTIPLSKETNNNTSATESIKHDDCTRNHSVTVKTEITPPISSSVIDVTQSQKLQVDASTQITVTSTSLVPASSFTKDIYNDTSATESIRHDDCTRNHSDTVKTEITPPISSPVIDVTISQKLQVNASTQVTNTSLVSTVPITKEINSKSESAKHEDCTRHHSNTTEITPLITSVSNGAQTQTESMTTASPSKPPVECSNYPEDCKRPSTWETTAQGETRDFLQILRAKFGTRVRLLRATTHWPRRAPFIIRDGNFIFGRHHES